VTATVELISHTLPRWVLYDLGERLGWEPEGDGTAPEKLIEFAGRGCYQSYGKPNPDTARTTDYVGNMLKQNHLSVIEHVSASFYLAGVSRSLTHELVRHRHFSFSQLSQRYVSMSGVAPVIPPLIEGNLECTTFLEDAFHDAVAAYEEFTELLVVNHPGATRKQLREVARALLPNCTPTSMVITGNLRSWLEFLEKRMSPAADAEIRGVALQVQALLADVAPTIFGDPVAVGSAQALPEFPG
jgi:thymidylate synthase (FAD)